MKPVAVALLAAVAALAYSASALADDVRKELTIGGRTRSYVVHLPSPATRISPIPLVVVLHGGGGNAASTEKQTGFSDEADRSGFIAAYPNGSGRSPLGERLLVWNAGSCCGYAVENHIDDITFIRAMAAQIQHDYGADPKRTYATGLSNGGMMAYRLACEASDVFAAIAPVSAVDTGASCRPTQPVSVIHFHGSADQNVPLAGGIGSNALAHDSRPPVADSISFWVHEDGCNPKPLATVSGAVRHDQYTDCQRGHEVSFYLIDGGGHAWPGGERMLRALDAPSSEISATPLIWAFFAAHPKP